MYGPLLEKAYAKLFSCYEFLIAGESIDAIVDFTGGLFERFNLFNIRNEIKENNKKCISNEPVDKTSLWDLIFSSFFMKSIMATCIKTKNKHSVEEIQKNGLVLSKLICKFQACEFFYCKILYKLLEISINCKLFTHV
jgi:calpain-5